MFVEHEKREANVPHRERPHTLDKPAKILLDAADLIEQYGLAKGTQRDAEGRYCTYGAVMWAATGYGGLALNGPAARAIERIQRAIGHSVAAWNNIPERSQGEVVCLLRRVALGR